MTLVLRYSARSDRGLVRQNNQDAVYAGPRLLALADGMGGHAGGERTAEAVPGAELLVIDDMAHDLPQAHWSQIIERITSLASRTPVA